MSKLKKISGKECVKILCNKFGFKAVRQTGSHMILKKETESEKVGTVVPMHNKIKVGTLKGVLELAKVNEDEFIQYVKNCFFVNSQIYSVRRKIILEHAQELDDMPYNLAYGS